MQIVERNEVKEGSNSWKREERIRIQSVAIVSRNTVAIVNMHVAKLYMALFTSTVSSYAGS